MKFELVADDETIGLLLLGLHHHVFHLIYYATCSESIVVTIIIAESS
jgi:hypothetical protein